MKFKLYVLEGGQCPDSNLVEHYMKANGLPYEKIEVPKDDRSSVEKVSDQKSVPVLLAEEKAYVGKNIIRKYIIDKAVDEVMKGIK